MENTIIDLRNKKILLISYHTENGEAVFQIITEDTVILLNREQMERLGYC